MFRKCGLLAFVTLLFLLPTAFGDLKIYDTFEKELLNDTMEVPAENYSSKSFYISIAGKTQNRVSVEIKEVNEKYVNVYLFDEENFKSYVEGKGAGAIFSARAVKDYSKVFVPDKSGNYYLVIENRDPFKKTVAVKVLWRYGVSAPDLIPELISSHPSEVFWGEKVYVDFKVKNFSPVKAERHEVVVYLEGENGKLYELGKVQVDQLLSEESKTFSVVGVISNELSRGLYRVKIVADPSNQVEEHNETNNVIYGTKVFVKGASLTSSTTSETNRTPGFEFMIALASLVSLSLLVRRGS
jgi:hypothetical protein